MPAFTYPPQAPLALTPAGFTGALPVENFTPGAHCRDNAIVVFSAGTAAEGLFMLGGVFDAGDTITYNIDGSGPITLIVASLSQAITALVASINANTLTNLVTARVVPLPAPTGRSILLVANTPGVAGNAITIVISTTSTTGEVAASAGTLAGGSVLVTPGIIPAPVNVASGIVGLAQHDSNANYGGTIIPPAPIQNVFGVSQVGGLLPISPSQTIVATLGYGVTVGINLTPSTGWIAGGTQQATIGTPVGLNIDPVTGFYVADPTLSNLVAFIVGKINGPFASSEALYPGAGSDVGNLGARVRIAFNAAALAVLIGE